MHPNETSSLENLDTEALGKTLEARAQEDLAVIGKNAYVYDSVNRKWVDLGGISEEDKAVISLPHIADKHKQEPPDIMIFHRQGENILVTPCDVKSSVGKAFQITRGRVFKSWQNEGFWENMAQAKVQGNPAIVQEAVNRAIEAKSTGREITQNILTEADAKISVGSGFFLTTLEKEAGGSRVGMAAALDRKQNLARTRLVITGVIEGQAETWLVIGKDEDTKLGADIPVQRPLNIGGVEYSVTRQGGKVTEESMSQLRDHDGNVIKEFPTKQENETLYKLIVRKK